MPVQPSVTRHTLTPGERPRGAQSAAVLRGAVAERAELHFVRPDGVEETVVLPPSALPAVADLLEHLAGSEAVALLAEDAEVTPEEAADLLGVSRPLVRRRMDAGLLPFRRVGAHRRLRLADVLALRARDDGVCVAMAELAADTEDLRRTHGV